MHSSSDSPPPSITPSQELPAKRQFLGTVWQRRMAGIALLLLLAGLATVLARWYWRHPDAPLAPPLDPRLGYKGRFLNIHPDVGYAGDSACRDCHPVIARAYSTHPMGRSLAPIDDRRDLFSDREAASGFTALNSRFRVERRGEQLWHRQTRLDAAGQPIYTLEHEVQYVIGSGTHGYSFLSARDGYLFQTPISWFRQKEIWGLSPSFNREKLSGRPVVPECLFCHANRVRPRAETRNGYETPPFDGHAIGCERCHGPGERHVQERSHKLLVRGNVDFTIVNPLARDGEKALLPPAVRDAVCEQCHLSGETRVLRRGRALYDFRPGLPLQQFWSIFVRDRRSEANQKAVNHVEQMHQSRCYLESSGENKLGCLSCHDPHEKIPATRRVVFYRERCLACHREHGCALAPEVRLRDSQQDSCIDCHMPHYATSDIPHTAATNHRIVRHAKADNHAEPVSTGSIVSFYPEDAGHREMARDRGIALARLAAKGKHHAAQFAGEALDLLEEALRSGPKDVPAWEARGMALRVAGRLPEALSAYETALHYAPRNEQALASAARLAQESGNLEKALDYWRRAVDVNPHIPDYHGNLALLLVHTRDWEQGGRQCQMWLRLDPGSREAHRLWIRCLREKGDHSAARAERELLRRLGD